MDKILLFIPGYNCEKQVVRVLAQLDAQMLPYFSEVLMVNNRSTDGTEQAVTDYARSHPELPLTLVRNDDNYNLGGSHKVAFAYAMEHGYSYVAVLHGDDQGNVHDLLPLLQSGRYRDYDCCLGARFMKGARLEGYSGLRTFVNRCLNLWFSVCCGKRIYDLGSGLNLYRVEPLRSGYYFRFPDRLYFNGVMVLAEAVQRQRMHFFPISWREEDQVSNAKLLPLGWRLLCMSFGTLFGRGAYLRREMRQTPVEHYTCQILETQKGGERP